MIDNLNHYRVFMAVAEAGSISLAARRLYISQPAVSKSIARLEEDLSTRLFRRSARGVELTDDGRLLEERLSEAFSTISKAEDTLLHSGSLGARELRIGSSSSLTRHVLMDYLTPCIEAYPHVKVTIDCHSTFHTLRLLAEGRIDIGLICETKLSPEFSFVPVREIHDIFVASDTYLKHLSEREVTESLWPFAGNITGMMTGEAAAEEKEEMSSIEILEKCNLMMLEKENITRKFLDHYFYEEGISPGQILEVNNMDLLLDFAVVGMGVSAVAREFVQEELSRGLIRELPLPDPPAPRSVGFVYLKQAPPTVLHAFI